METLNSLIEKYKVISIFFKILTYPIYSIVTNTIVLALSMKNIFSKLFLKNELRMFSEEKAINNYWYDTMALNLQKHGRLGYSKTTLDNEKYLVGRWFHISKYSLYPYWKSSVISVLLSWILIPLVFYFLFPSTSSNWFFSVTFLTIIGSAYFSQLEGQNYNILGWVFFPFLFWSIENNYVLVLAVIISFLFLTSFTAYFVSFGYLATAFITDMLTIHEILFVQLFSIPLVIYRFYPLYKKGHLKSHFITIGNTIGLFKNSEAKYSRNIRNNKALLFGILRSLIFLTFILYLNTNSSPYYLWLVLGYQIVNSFLARFADVETIDMLIILTSFYYMLNF